MFDRLSSESSRRVLAGLAHSDPRVVQMSLSILDTALTDPEVIDALLDRLAVVPPGDIDDPDNRRPGMVARAGRSRLNASQLDRFLDVTTPLDRSGATLHLMPLIFSVPTCRDHASTLASDPRLSEDERKAVQNRLEYLQLSPEELWTQLLQIEKQLDETFDADGGTSDDYEALEQMSYEAVRVAAEHAVLRGRSARILQKWTDGNADPHAVIAAHLLAANADAQALPALLGVIRMADPDEDEIVRDRAMTALGHLLNIEFDEDTVEFLSEADRYDFQSIARFVGRFRSDRAIDTLIRCYREGSDEEYVARGCVAGLMERVELTGEAREIALTEAMRDSSEDEFWDLPEEVATLSVLLGWDDEQSRAVRTRVGSELDRREYRKSAFPGRSALSRILDRLDAFASDPYDDEPYDDEPAGIPYDEAPSPYVRAEPKVGRNDPCTCGSGKKYKKCCGK